METILKTIDGFTNGLIEIGLAALFLLFGYLGNKVAYMFVGLIVGGLKV
jgi:hypothetical protein